MTTEKHQSQIRILAQLEKLRAAIESLPPDAEVGLFGVSAVYLDRDVFVRAFRGKLVTVDTTENKMTITVDGVEFRSVGPRNDSLSKHEVTL